MEYVYNLDNINKASKLVIDNIKTTVVRIDGKMGAGKTKIISNICMQLGVKEVITSPTLMVQYIILIFIGFKIQMKR